MVGKLLLFMTPSLLNTISSSTYVHRCILDHTQESFKYHASNSKIKNSVTTSQRSHLMRTSAAVSIATSVPAPIAIPTSAAASAGESVRF